jgi:hypothetical protein
MTTSLFSPTPGDGVSTRGHCEHGGDAVGHDPQSSQRARFPLRSGLATRAPGALATWAGPIRQAFEVPASYRLICGVSIGYASSHPVNQYNPGRASADSVRLSLRNSAPPLLEPH